MKKKLYQEPSTKSKQEEVDTLRLNFIESVPKHLLDKNKQLTLECFLWYLKLDPKNNIATFLNMLTTATPNICSEKLIDFMQESIIKDFSKFPEEQKELQSQINILIAQQSIYPQNTIQQPQTSREQSCFPDR